MNKKQQEQAVIKAIGEGYQLTGQIVRATGINREIGRRLLIDMAARGVIKAATLSSGRTQYSTLTPRIAIFKKTVAQHDELHTLFFG